MRRWQLGLAAGLVCIGLGAGVLALASAPKASDVYEGKSSQKRPVKMRVSLDGDLVRGFTIGRSLTCRRGSRRNSLSGRFRQVRAAIEVRETGAFHGELKVRGTAGSGVRRGRVCLRGEFRRNGRVIRGRYREVLRLRDGALCRTGLLRFVARAPS